MKLRVMVKKFRTNLRKIRYILVVPCVVILGAWNFRKGSRWLEDNPSYPCVKPFPREAVTKVFFHLKVVPL